MTKQQAELIEQAQGKGFFERSNDEMFACMFQDEPEKFRARMIRREQNANMNNIQRVERDLAATERFLTAERLGIPHHGQTDERL